LMLVLAGRRTHPGCGAAPRCRRAGASAAAPRSSCSTPEKPRLLGTRVADDVVWGSPAGSARGHRTGLLAEVGLDGLGERDTPTACPVGSYSDWRVGRPRWPANLRC